MATLDSNKVTGVSVVSDATDAANGSYADNLKYASTTGNSGRFLEAYPGNGVYWTLRTSGFGTTDITAAYYGNGYYVIGGAQTLSSSTDAIGWFLRTTGTSQTFNSIVYGDQYTSGKDIFVSGSSVGEVRYSTDSIGWFLRTSSFGLNSIYRGTYSSLNGGEFLLGGPPPITTSYWTLRTAGTNINITSSTYGLVDEMPTYLIGLSGTRFLKGSTDTIVWVIRTNGGSGSSINGIAYGLIGTAPTFISVDQNTQINTSTDSITWTLRTSGQTTSGIFYTTAAGSLGLDKENFIVGGNSSTNIPLLKSSSDAIAWTIRTCNRFGTTSITASNYGGEFYFIGGNSANPPANAPFNVSTDGIIWQFRTSGTSANIAGFAYGTNNGVPNYIFYGQIGLIATSTDTNSWTVRTGAQTGFGGTVSGLVYNNGVYVAVDQLGNTRISTDATSWTVRTSATGITASYTLTYGNNYYVVGAQSGILAASVQDTNTTLPLLSNYGLGILLQASTDSITWTIRTAGYGTQTISALTSGDSYALASGTNDNYTQFLISSTDNNTWAFRTSGFGISAINALTYGNSIYVASGAGGTLMTSTNTIFWTFRTSGSTSNLQALTYGNDAYISGNSNGEIRYSSDAIIWSLRTSYSANAINTLIYGNSQYISGRESGALDTSIITNQYWQSINSSVTTSGLPTYKGYQEFTISGAQTFYIPPTASQFYIEAIGAGGGGDNGTGTASGGGGGSGSYNSWLIRRPELGNASTITVTPGAGGIGGNGVNGSMSTSTDGNTWTALNSMSPSDVTCITYGNGLYLSGNSTAGSLRISTDGIIWSARSTATSNTTDIAAGQLSGSPRYVLTNLARLYYSTDGNTWTLVTTTGTATNGRRVFYGNDIFIQVADVVSSAITEFQTSADGGATWTLRTSGLGANPGYSGGFYSTISNNNENAYVAFTNTGSIVTSSNSIFWKLRTSGFTTGINRGIYVNGNYNICGNSGLLALSTDCVVWSFRTSGFGSTNINAITFANNTYAIGGDGGTLSTSSDFITWTSRTSLFKTSSINGLAYGTAFIAGGVQLAATAGGNTTVSWTGNSPSGTITYTLTSAAGGAASGTTAGTAGAAAAVTLNPLYTTAGFVGASGLTAFGTPNNATPQANTFQITGGAGGAYNTSTGGSSTSYYYGNTYTASGGNASGGNAIGGIPGSYTGNIGSGGGGGGALSSGFNSWDLRTSSGTSNILYTLMYDGTNYYGAGASGTIVTSSNALYWVLRTSGTANSLGNTGGGGNGLVYASGQTNAYVASGASATIATSPDGVTWTLRTTGWAVTTSITSMAYGLYNGTTPTYVIGGTLGALATSTNAIFWTFRSSGSTVTYNGIAFGNVTIDGTATDTFVAVSSGAGPVRTSTDGGTTWILRTSGFGATDIRNVIYANNIFVACGNVGRVITSTNAIFWTLRTSGAATAITLQALTYGNGNYITGSATGGFRNSTDGITWNVPQTGSSAATASYALTFGNNLYVAATNAGTITTSNGGTSQSVAGSGGDATRGGGGGGGGSSFERYTYGVGGNGGDGYVKITWW